MPFWLPIVVGIGLVAGVAFVVVGIALRPAPVPARSDDHSQRHVHSNVADLVWLSQGGPRRRRRAAN